jgi:radical SAM protein with 4Fe4S-binding SPASM domain
MKYQKLPWQVVMAYNRSREYKYWCRICHAPYKSLYFSFNGSVHSCCVNREHVLGTYPEHTLLEIWNGEKRRQLARHINHRDLTLGCHECRYYLEKGNVDDLRAKYYDYPVRNRKYPVFMEFELHNTCNLECVMCGGNFSSLIRRNREQRPPLPMVYDDGFVGQLEPFLPHLHKAQFAGGEPFLIHIYYQIWERLLEVNPDCIIGVQTNGTILNERVKQFMEKGRFQIGVSVDSLQKDVYEAIRVNADLENVLDNITWFADYSRSKNIHLHITVCPMRMNWKEIPDLVAFCNRIDAYIRFNNVWQPLEYALWNLSSGEIAEKVDQLSRIHFDGDGKVGEENRRYYATFLAQMVAWQREALAREMKQDT